MTEKSQKLRKSLPKKIIPVLIIAWFSLIGIGVFSLNTIINPQKLNSEKNNLNDSIVPEPPPELVISELPEDTENATLSFFTLILLLLACSGGSLLVTYILRILVTSKAPKKTVKTPKISPKKPQKTHFTPPLSPTITIIPPQESTPVDRKNHSLANMMDLRKRRSLVSIMHDN